MRRWIVPPLLVAAAGLLLTADPSAAQDKKVGSDPVEETATTADGVKLRVKYYKSQDNPGGSPVVIMMYTPAFGTTDMKAVAGRDMTKGEWDNLARTLTTKGYNVIRFDWRGHGKSTDVDRTRFWNVITPGAATGAPNPVSGPVNQRLVKGYSRANPSNSKTEIKVADFSSGYLPVLVNDLAAIRQHVDSKNDLGELNASTVYLIGERDAAAIGMLWLTAEWARPDVHPTLNQGAQYRYCPDPSIIVNTPAGETVAGAIWLSPSNPSSIPDFALRNFLTKYAPRLRENNPMLFLFGEKDATGKRNADYYYRSLLNAEGKGNVPKLSQTNLKGLAAAQSGQDLLGKNAELQTETLTEKFLDFIQKDRKSIPRKPRKYDSPYFINLPSFGLNP